jgi:hypothetical protein
VAHFEPFYPPMATQCDRLPISIPAAFGLMIFIEIESFSIKLFF